MGNTLRPLLVAIVVLAACSGDEHTEAASEDSCESWCQKVLAACGEDSATAYPQNCQPLCEAKRESLPEGCRGAFDRINACMAAKMNVTCATGIPSYTPVGACASEGAACYKCSPECL